jgi:hypothetical protein
MRGRYDYADFYGPEVSMRTGMRLGLSLCLLGLLSATSSEAQWINYPTPGIPRLPDGKPNLSAPAPRTADGKPDLSGLWESPCLVVACGEERLYFNLTRGQKPGAVVMTPWAVALQQQRESRDHVDDPFGYCLPPGVPRIHFVIGSYRIVSTPTVTAFLHETAAGGMFRQVFTDGRPLPTVTEPSWLGYSVGRWEGETFVVDTTGFRDRGWLDTRKGHPHSDALRVVERFRRRDFGHIDLEITIDDPKAFVKPWTVTTVLTYHADWEILESFCDNHDKTMEHRRIAPAPPEAPSPR